MARHLRQRNIAAAKAAKAAAPCIATKGTPCLGARPCSSHFSKVTPSADYAHVLSQGAVRWCVASQSVLALHDAYGERRCFALALAATWSSCRILCILACILACITLCVTLCICIVPPVCLLLIPLVLVLPLPRGACMAVPRGLSFAPHSRCLRFSENIRKHLVSVRGLQRARSQGHTGSQCQNVDKLKVRWSARRSHSTFTAMALQYIASKLCMTVGAAPAPAAAPPRDTPATSPTSASASAAASGSCAASSASGARALPAAQAATPGPRHVHSNMRPLPHAHCTRK
jgi:hypothetical protein